MIVTATSLSLPFAAGTFHAALGSPPYWGGLRVYSGPQLRPWPAIAYCPMPGLPPVEIPAQAVPLGHEPDPFAFVGHLLQVFREVRRTLRPEGVLSVNLGDCYVNDSKWGGATGGKHVLALHGSGAGGRAKRQTGIPPKSLVLMPWRFALAMQADGWVLRSRMPGGVEMEPDIVWKKSSTMPESVRDRPTNDFEDVLIFAQGPRYFWDQEAGREGYQDHRDRKGASGGSGKSHAKIEAGRRDGDCPSSTLATGSGASGRNMRAVWTINPEPTDEEHYAAWPVELAARLIRVTTSERGCCPECGAPWERVMARTDQTREDFRGSRFDTGRSARRRVQNGERFATVATGWRPTCDHDAEPVPCRVLDPFAGLGRTWEAARETGRRFAGADLSLEYCRIARSRSVLAAAERRRAAESKRPRTITGPLFDEEPRTPSPGA